MLSQRRFSKVHCRNCEGMSCQEQTLICCNNRVRGDNGQQELGLSAINMCLQMDLRGFLMGQLSNHLASLMILHVQGFGDAKAPKITTQQTYSYAKGFELIKRPLRSHSADVNAAQRSLRYARWSEFCSVASSSTRNFRLLQKSRS